MYTLVNMATGLVQEINVSESDFQAGNYIDAGKGLVAHYIEDNITGTPIVGTTKFDKPTVSWVMLTWSEIKVERNKILQDSDWRDLPSYPGTDQTAWRTYRQQLRDIPQDYDNVADVVWPDKP